jgi:diguanylate cyclase (GGDEF)-like protein/PAS domain S-box-containing protein
MFDMPDFLDRNEERRVDVLRAVLYSVLVITVFSAVIGWFTTPDMGVVLELGGGIVVMCGVGLWLLHKGKTNLVSVFVVIFMWLFFLILSYFQGGVSSSLLVGHLVVVIIAMVMINRLTGWLIVVASVIARMLIPFFITSYGFLPNVLSESSMHRSFSQMMLLIIGAVFLDISMTGLNQFLKVSRKFEQRYRALFERSNDAIFILNMDLELVETNQNGELMLEYSLEELLNMKIDHLVVRPEELIECIDKLLTGDAAPIKEFQLITKGGGLVDVEMSLSLVRNEGESPHYLQCVARDVRERKKTKSKLMEYTQRYQAMFDSTVDAVFLLELNGEPFDANEQAAKMLGYRTIKDLIETPISHIIVSGEEIHMQQVIDDLKTGKKLPEYDRKMIRKDGRKIIVEVSAGLVTDSDGRPLYLQTICRDVTLKRMREERLETSLAEMEILAMTDPLTKLWNRRAIYEQAQIYASDADLNQEAFSVILIDVDLLKDINDQYGHHAGDIALIHVAAQLEMGKRKPDRAGRWGGDEFLIILPRTGIKEAEILARRLHDLISGKNLEGESGEFQIGTSIGVAGTDSVEGGEYDLEMILDMADKAMYLAKEAGRQGVAVFRQGEEEG